MQDAAIKAAVERLKREEPFVVEQQVRLCEIPAPPFHEAARAAAYSSRSRRSACRTSASTAVGNVLGERAAGWRFARTWSSARISTPCFPPATKVVSTRSGSSSAGPASATTAGVSPFCWVSSEH